MGSMNHLIDELNQIKEKFRREKSGNRISTLSISEVKELAKKYNTSTLEIEITALENEIFPSRYKRNYNLISFSEQIQLLCSEVAIIGCGGLGGNIIEMLARLGIGNLIIVDGDKFNESNLNRQLFCTEDTIGKGKAEIATARIQHINSSIRTKAYSQFIDSANILEMIQGVNVVMDALDNIPSRFVLEKACQSLNVPFIHGAISGFDGQVSTIFPEDKGLEVIYGSPERYSKQKKPNRVSAPAMTPALVASFQVAEAIKVLLHRGKLVQNRLLLLNAEEMDWNVLEISG